MAEAKGKGLRDTKKRVGLHVSIKGGLPCIFEHADSQGGCAAAFFLRNQRTWRPPQLPAEKVRQEFAEQMVKHGIAANCLLPHGNYLVNLGNASADERELLAKSKACFLDEMKRCELLGIPLLNIHPGSTKGKVSIDESCSSIADAINEAHSKVKNVSVILEIMAGGGNTVGKTFEELKMIIDGVQDKGRVGVCLDTCHMFAAGYDIRTQESYNATMSKFEEVIGFQYLKAMHLNDSKAGLNSKVDRHESIGKGYVGLEAFRCLMNDSRLDGIPLVLETPCPHEDSYRDEIQLLLSLEGKTETYPPPPEAMPSKKEKKSTKAQKMSKRAASSNGDTDDEEDAFQPPAPPRKKRAKKDL